MSNELKVVLSTFDEYENDYGTFTQIDGVQNMSNKELYKEIEKQCNLYIQKTCICIDDRELVFKMMFIRNQERQKTWCEITKGSTTKIVPLSKMYMSSVFKYDKYGNLNKICYD